MTKVSFYQKLLSQLEALQNAVNTLRETVKAQIQEDAAK